MYIQTHIHTHVCLCYTDARKFLRLTPSRRFVGGEGKSQKEGIKRQNIDDDTGRFTLFI